MEKLRSLLELYGALDEAVVQSDDPVVAHTVDRFLPGASANQKWYGEIERFFFGEAPGGAREVPNLGEALGRIATANRESELTTPQKYRLFYGIATCARLQSVAPTKAVPKLTDSNVKEPLIQALAVVGPTSIPIEQREENANSQLDEFLRDVPNMFTAPRAFDATGEHTADMQLLDEDVLKPRSCLSAIVNVDGREAVCVDTDLRGPDPVSLNDLKAIIDPRNWNKDYPDFFLAMKPLSPPRQDNWGRVLETVGLGAAGFGRQIVTDLKYYKSEPTESDARLEYDLDDPTPGAGDGQVLIDRGFINMSAVNGDPTRGPVHVRTRKVVHIRGLSPFAQQRLVCITGYGTAAKEFMFDAAQNPPQGVVPWDEPVDAPDRTGQAVSASSKPSRPPIYVAQTVVESWLDLAEDLTNRSFELSEKWFKERVDFDDLVDYSKAVGGRLLSAPWEFMDAMTRSRYGGGESDDRPGGGTR